MVFGQLSVKFTLTLTRKYGAPIVTNGGLFTIGNSHCAAARLLLAEFLELQARRAGEPLARFVANRRSNGALLSHNYGQTCLFLL